MILDVNKLNYSYPHGPAVLKDISFNLGSGEVMAILGPNGAGKTTLLKVTMGVLKASSGRCTIDGEDISKLSPKKLWSKISYVPQSKLSTRSLSCLDLVLLGLAGKINSFSSPSAEDRKSAYELMKELKIEKLAEKKCDALSGGELQMVLIARALISKPKLLILDEPESGLDFRNQLIVLDTMAKLKDDGISCIFNTHYPEHALMRADKALLFIDEHTVFGHTEDVITEENIERSFGVRARIEDDYIVPLSVI
ncbi:MAG: ABC transporter ATP-binding protein [Lachnospiraceae bacterium]|nr:ABC transporter ATP-binding protein [Lachnospiraceae bacterium]